MRALHLAALLVTLGACKHDPAPPQLAAADWERGYAAVNQVRSQLFQALNRALVQGAPAAVAACSTEAPAITAGLSQHGVVVGRATRKPRNPANLASGWQADALAQFEGDVAAGRPLKAARFLRPLPDGRLGYAEPLVIQPMCLACHGAALAPDVTAALAERYPGDRATGYQAGELRGLVWAELPPRS